MNLLFAAPDAGMPRSPRALTRLRGMLALTAITPLVLVGCAVEEEPDADSGGTPTAESTSSVQEEPEQPETSESAAEEEAEADAEAPAEEGPSVDDLPDPDDMDMERTEELGAYFSEEEACLSIGSLVDGLSADMNEGIEEQGVLDEAYEAVEQTYILVPDELREPLENILTLLDTDVEDLDEEEVLVAAEPVDGWLTVEFCDGEYHNQNLDGAPVPD